MAGALAVAIGVPLLWIGLSWVNRLGRGGASSGVSENMTILSPADWVGKDFPITSSNDPAT